MDGKKQKNLILSILIILFISACNTNISSQRDELDIVDESDIVYEWLKSIQNDNGLLPSYEYMEFQESESGYEYSLYDNSLAIIAFTIKKDYVSAEKILDFFNNSLQTEFNISPGGFSQFRYSNGEPQDNKKWVGDNAWLLIAINNYHHLTQTSKYSALASELTIWLKKLQDDDGGIKAGYYFEGNNVIEDDNKVIEANIDVFNAVDGYTNFHINILNYLRNSRWDNENKLFIAWPNSNFTYALDTSSWGYSGLPHMPIDILINASRFEVNNGTVSGYCFDEDLDTIWLEGTLEMIVSFNTAGLNDSKNFYLEEMEKLFIPGAGNSNLYGLPYVTDNSGTGYGTNSLNPYTDKTPWVSSSAWYIFAKEGFDPLSLGNKSDIPENSILWE